MQDHQINKFQSQRLGSLNLEQVVSEAIRFIEEENNSHFRLVIGTDSELVENASAHFVSAIVVHHVGHGGVYFWGGVTRQGVRDLRQRMYEEATYSLALAQQLIEEFKKKNFPIEKILEIHVDVGEIGETRKMINEIVGMVKGSGFQVKTKPNSFGASNVADRHT